MPNRTRSLSLALCLFAGAAVLSCAGASAQLLEGRDYRTLTPAQPAGSSGKIEVLEFFSYGCPHCNDFYPLVSAWAEKLPKDVAFKGVAVGFGRPAWVNLARAYYALQASGDIKRLDGPLFHAIHEQHLPLFDEQTIANWVGKQGGDATRFTNAYTSFGVNNQTVQADQMVEDYRVEGIPTLAIDGKYVVISPSQAADERAVFLGVLALADQVIAKVRAERRAARIGGAPGHH
ncbi:MAG: thiol:disulfide interchange protein DsbA/DsbL [Steroidobacteraceae bacterium]